MTPHSSHNFNSWSCQLPHGPAVPPNHSANPSRLAVAKRGAVEIGPFVRTRGLTVRVCWQNDGGQNDSVCGRCREGQALANPIIGVLQDLLPASKNKLSHHTFHPLISLENEASAPTQPSCRRCKSFCPHHSANPHSYSVRNASHSRIRPFGKIIQRLTLGIYQKNDSYRPPFTSSRRIDPARGRSANTDARRW